MIAVTIESGTDQGLRKNKTDAASSLSVVISFFKSIKILINSKNKKLLTQSQYS